MASLLGSLLGALLFLALIILPAAIAGRITAEQPATATTERR